MRDALREFRFRVSFFYRRARFAQKSGLIPVHIGRGNLEIPSYRHNDISSSAAVLSKAVDFVPLQ
jgi:hypothetical protein